MRAVIFVIQLLLVFAQWKPGDGITHHLPIENSHSLYPPMDASLHYWRYGNSAVAGRQFVRLTPAAQSRSGWLYNHYPIKSNDWEMELGFSVRSTYHLGGDGFAIWILDRTGPEDRNLKEKRWVEGGVLGMRDDFNGFGVLFDTYDNDQNRKNPAVLVLKNDGSPRAWDHDKDFDPDRVKESHKEMGTSCQLDYRNTVVTSAGLTRVMLRYQSGILHVYTDTGSSGYKVCLAVKLDIKTLDTHYFAFTAVTGAVADIHEIQSIVVRYLDKDDPELDDWSLARQESTSRIWWTSFIQWTVFDIVGFYLTWLTYKEFNVFKTNITGNTALLCSRINASRRWSSKICAGLFTLLVLRGEFFAALLGAPKFLIHTWEFMTNFNLNPKEISKLNSRKGHNPMTYWYIELGSVAISLIYYCWRVGFP